jgi:hypothetical protein
LPSKQKPSRRHYELTFSCALRKIRQRHVQTIPARCLMMWKEAIRQFIVSSKETKLRKKLPSKQKPSHSQGGLTFACVPIQSLPARCLLI